MTWVCWRDTKTQKRAMFSGKWEGIRGGFLMFSEWTEARPSQTLSVLWWRKKREEKQENKERYQATPQLLSTWSVLAFSRPKKREGKKLWILLEWISCMIAVLMWLEVFNNDKSFGLPLKLYPKKEKIRPDQKVSQKQWKKKNIFVSLWHLRVLLVWCSSWQV